MERCRRNKVEGRSKEKEEEDKLSRGRTMIAVAVASRVAKSNNFLADFYIAHWCWEKRLDMRRNFSVAKEDNI